MWRRHEVKMNSQAVTKHSDITKIFIRCVRLEKKVMDMPKLWFWRLFNMSWLHWKACMLVCVFSVLCVVWVKVCI